MTVSLTFQETAWFLPICLPVCLWVIHSDLRDMRIPNAAVLILLMAFLCIGPFLLALDLYGLRLLQGALVLLAGFVVTSLGLVGAGDSKFAAAMALYVAAADALVVLMVFSGIVILSFAAHRTARAIPAIRRATPAWTSWEQTSTFPMGIALAPTLIIYLAFGLSAPV